MNYILKIFFLLLFSFFTSLDSIAEVSPFKKENLDQNYLISRDELKDYIIDTGDELNIQFENIPEFSKIYKVDSEGEIFFESIKKTYVRGLTISELESLLEKSFAEFLVNPDIFIRISKFKPIRFRVKGEVRNPGVFILKASTNNQVVNDNLQIISKKDSNIKNLISTESPGNTELLDFNNNFVNTVTIALKKAGGLTSYSDVSKIEIIRNNPLGKGGGNKRAIINLNKYLNGYTGSNQDIRIYSGDTIIIPRLPNPDKRIVLKSILTGISPRFISVKVLGNIENPGTYLLPLEGSLSDAMNLSGPRKPLSGKIYLLRYERDGSLLRKKLEYSSSSKAGSSKNIMLMSGDILSVQESFYGRFSKSLKVVTEPFLGIYTTKELYESLSGN